MRAGRSIVVLAGLLLFTWWLPVDAATYWVQASGGTTQASCAAYTTGSTDPGFYLRTIQAGINCATSGTNTVQVKTGVYSESLSFSGKSNLTVSGIGGTPQVTSTSTRCVDIVSSSSNVTIQAMNIGPCLGQGVHINGSSSIKLYDNYIHVENLASSGFDTRNGIFIDGNATNTDIQGNVIAFGESNLGQQGASISGTRIVGNYSLNPTNYAQGGVRGQHFYHHGAENSSNTSPALNGVIQSNLLETKAGQLVAARMEDFINTSYSTGVLIDNNWITGEGTNYNVLSASGCAILSEFYGITPTISNNKIYMAGHCGIGIGGGNQATVSGNFLQSSNWNFDGAAVGLFFHNYSAGLGDCNGPHSATNNIVAWQNGNANGAYLYNYQDNGDCGTITLSGNNFNGPTAWTSLDPLTTTHPKPLIPPVPKNCVAVSPYTTQTGTSCSAAANPAPSFTFTASSPVSSGATSTLTWSAVTNDVSSGCVASVLSGQSDTAWSTAGAGPSSAQLIAGGSKSSTARTATTVYRMTCTGTGGTTTIDQTVLVTDTTPPAVVTGMALTSASPASPARLSTSWTAVGDADLASYNLYLCSTGGSCTPNVLYGNVGNVTGIILRGLLGNTSYRACVKAVDTSMLEQPTCSNIPTAVATEIISAGSPELQLSFEVGSGSTVYDDSGHAHNSTSSTGSFVALAPANGGTYSGSYSGAQETRIPRTTALEPSGPTAFTMASWVRRSGAQAASSTIAGKSWGNSIAPSYTSYKILINPSAAGTDVVGCELGYSGNVAGLASAATALPDLTWTHVACTYDPSAVAPQWKLYINGALTLGNSATRTDAVVYDTTTAGDFYVSGTGSGAERMTGQVDEVRMYPRALSQAEVQVLAAVGDTLAPAAPTNLRVVSP